MVPSGSTRDRDSRHRRTFRFALSLRALCSAALCLMLSGLLGSCVPRNRTTTTGGADAPDRRYDASVVWAWIHGSETMSTPPIIRVKSPDGTGSAGGFGSNSLTINCDIVADAQPSLALVLIHCDRDWKPTQSVFIQEQNRLTASDFVVEYAPIGVQNYDYSASITFPSTSNTIDIRHSGNYLARVVDLFDQKKVLAELRFFAVESSAGVSVRSYSDFFTSAWTEKVQDGLKVRVEVVPGFQLFSTQVTGVTLYEQGKWLKPMVADDDSKRRSVERGEYRATWSPFYGGKIVAEFWNLPAGNEYRLLDLSDLVDYPSIGGVQTTRLSDQPRFGSFSEQDNNGLLEFPYVPPQDDDLVYFEFRLDLDGEEVYDDMAVVGAFNDWIPTWEWRLVYNPETGLYTARGWLKRALHQYEYVSGRWNVDNGRLEQAEGTLIEGNNVYTSKTFYALAYYRDQTALSYDRIIGVGSTLTGGR